MGAPKQKWTQEEEAALRAGVVKHGAGKWRTILKDPEYSGVLCLRSNVDLKDKWRNLSVTANGWGSRERGRLAVKKNHSVVKYDINQLAITTVPEGLSDEILDAKPLQVSHEGLPGIGSKKSQLRIESLILEAITSLKEPTGSNKTVIGEYIEDQYHSPPNFTRLLSHKLKVLTAAGKLIKVKRKYRIAPSSGFQDQTGSKPPPFEGSQKEHAKAEVKDTKLLTKSQIDAELEKIRNMTALEAAAAAARAIAEAEAATEEAEEAAREAEAAEADAEAAHAFALAAMDTLKGRMSDGPSMIKTQG